MKVLLVNPLIREWQAPTHPPLGLGYIAAVLRNNGIDVSIYDVNLNRWTHEQSEEHIKEWKADIVGIGGMITTYNEVKWLCSTIKKHHPKLPVLVGGAVGDVLPELTLERIQTDFVVIGEAEYTMLELCHAIRDKKTDFNEIAGLAYKKGGAIIKTEKRHGVKDLDTVPFPAYDMLNVESYLKNQDIGAPKFKRRLYISSTRGCAYACTFCCKSFRQYAYRCRSVDNTIAEIKMLKEKYNLDYIGFSDDLFVFHKPRILEFCQKYKESGLNLPWDCNGRVNVVDEEVLRAMKDAHCVGVAYGIESGSQKMLDVMRKFAKVDQAKIAIRQTRKAGIYPNLTFIVGMPGETKETIKETVDFCKELRIPATLFFANAYPGTPLFEQVKERIYAKYDMEDYLQKLMDVKDFVMNFTEMSNDELLQAKIDAEKELRRHLYTHPVDLFLTLKDYYVFSGGLVPLAKAVYRKLKFSRATEDAFAAGA